MQKIKIAFWLVIFPIGCFGLDNNTCSNLPTCNARNWDQHRFQLEGGFIQPTAHWGKRTLDLNIDFGKNATRISDRSIVYLLRDNCVLAEFKPSLGKDNHTYQTFEGSLSFTLRHCRGDILVDETKPITVDKDVEISCTVLPHISCK